MDIVIEMVDWPEYILEILVVDFYSIWIQTHDKGVQEYRNENKSQMRDTEKFKFIVIGHLEKRPCIHLTG